MPETRNFKKIVVSAINLSEGGALSILKECLTCLSDHFAPAYEIIALVHDQNQFNFQNIKFYSFPKSKRSWFTRLYYEYIYFLFLSKKLKPFLWLSLHDMTPNVKADIRAVYCHNPSPFYKLTLKDVFLDFRFALFNLFYRSLYRMNIKKNDFIIVQQGYLRKKFRLLTKDTKIIVAHPNINFKIKGSSLKQDENIFFYPAFPRVFKNFEVIGEASKILVKEGITNFQVIYTIRGDENAYAKYIFKSFNAIENIKFIGIQSSDEIAKIYQKASCIIFPSKLETWGMPITEAKFFSKPLLLADLDYAHETLGVYDQAAFFGPDDPKHLALLMKDMINKNIKFTVTKGKDIDPPFTENWQKLFDLILSSKEDRVFYEDR